MPPTDGPEPARSDVARRVDAILAVGDSEDATLWAIQALLEDVIPLPADARVGGERVLLSRIEYEGYPEQGLVAEIIVGERHSRVPLTEVHVLSRVEGSQGVLRYRRWRQGVPAQHALAQVSPTSSADSKRPCPDGPAELVIVSVGPRAARCRHVCDDSDVVFRLGPQQWLAPGTIITSDLRQHGATVSGEITDLRIDAGVLDLSSDAAADPDLIEQASQLATFGDPTEARNLLHQRLDDDMGDLDAHHALGQIAFGDDPGRALAHFAVGAAIGERRGDVDAPSYHRCLYGCGRTLMRLGRPRDAWTPLARLLELDPDDALGVVELLRAAGHPSPESPGSLSESS